ncbi:MAG: U32 family peptidase [Clostridia bacterium]|nr:U32 family peptidase [Clostridia bacterium]
MAHPELLAPAGGKEQLYAAVRCGADAVYLGARSFNARRRAENFDEGDLKEVVSYCHARGVAVHVTVNTLLTDGEMPELLKTAEEIAASGADAVIVQDLAVMRIFLSRYPSLPVHASTQCAVHNAGGVKFFEDMGVSRVVLARELSVEEIAEIRSKTKIELEAFIHGALCMCISGACCLSSVLGGRSGNRGLCAQPCRLDFKSPARSHALSLKDMSHLKYLDELESAGVCSFKIEGRMKRPEYVAAAVTAARAALEGRPYDEETLRAVFSRSGFTDGYASGRREDMFGCRSHDDVTAAAGVLKSLSSLYSKETPRVPVSMALFIDKDGSRLDASARALRVSVHGGAGIVPEKAATDKALSEKYLSKCGGTQFYLSELELSNPAHLMLPPSEINDLRRRALEELNAALLEPRPHAPAPFAFEKTPYAPPENAEYWARFENRAQVCGGFDKIILPINEIDGELISKYGSALLCELPFLCFPKDEASLESRLEKLKAAGLFGVYAENAYAARLSKKLGLKIYGGAGLNILNTAALREYEKAGLSAATLSFELNMSKIERLGGALPRGYLVYGRLPLMRFRNCPVKPPSGCGACRGTGELSDRTGARFTVLCGGKKFGTLLNGVPLHLGGKRQAKADFKLLYFTTETREECERIRDEIKQNKESSLPRTGGLYYRELK